MHMTDALLSPTVGLGLCLVSAATIASCSRTVSRQLDERMVPLMGVLGAFLFTAQMINFSIPGTGSSGHLGGGLLLAILLGSHAALLTMASVLLVQALFFADGGLLALGCNIFNLGFLPAFVAYPLVYRKLAGDRAAASRRSLAIIVAAVLGLQLGAFGVVGETVLSGRSALPLATFAFFMQAIHLAIGIVEGAVTAVLVAFIHRARPEVLFGAMTGSTANPLRSPCSPRPLRGLLAVLLALSLLGGGFFSWFASTQPDGLEWSIARAGGKDQSRGPEAGAQQALATLQGATALLPGYAFRPAAVADPRGSSAASPPATNGDEQEKLASSVAGIVGGLIVLALALLIGALLKRGGRSAP